MDIRELEAVVAVNTYGSFSAAAAALFISQPALTRRVALLEREVELRIFIRTPRGVKLTDAGKVLIASAERALMEMQGIRKSLKMIHSGSGGTIRIAVSRNMGSDRLGHLIARFHSSSPNFVVKIASAESGPAALASVQSGEHDLAVVDSQAASASIGYVDLWDEDYLAVFAAPRSVDLEGSAVIPTASAQMLHGRPMVHLPEAQFPNQQARQLFSMVGVEPQSTIEAADMDLLVSIASGGRGVAVVPRRIALNARAHGASVAEPPVPIRTTARLAYRTAEMSPVAARFLGMASSPALALSSAS